MLIHREALALASNANEESDGRYCLNFVKVTKEGHVIGCDGHHFLRIKAKVEAPSLLDALLPQATEEDIADAMIPADVLASFAAGIKKMDGHRAQKATWLYACRTPLPLLVWGKSDRRVRLEDGFHSAEERRRKIRTGTCQRLSKRERSETPAGFRDLLIGMASAVELEQIA